MIFGRKAEVELLTERQVYVAGETLNARARIWGKGDLQIEEARIELQRHQKFDYKRRERDSDGRQHWSSVSGTESTTIATARVLGPGHLADGQFFEQFHSFPLLDSLEPSGKASLLSTSWSLDLILDRRRAIDITSSASFTILAPAAQNSARTATKPRSRSAAVCAVVPQIATRDHQVGATIAGTLVVFAQYPAEARAIRVELVRIEQTEPPSRSEPTRGEQNSTTVVKQQIAAGGALPVGVPWGFPFTLSVPPDAHPTSFTARGDVRWLVRGVIDRSFAEDFTGEIEINIANAPAFAPPPSPPELGTAGAGALNLDAATFAALDREVAEAVPMTETVAVTARETAAPQSLLLDAGEGGPLAGHIYPLAAPLVSIGRRDDNLLVVPDAAVSRVHAEIRRAGSDYLLRDLGSTAGTYLNGAPLVGEQALQPGDIVGIGPAVTFVVHSDQSGAD